MVVQHLHTVLSESSTPSITTNGVGSSMVEPWIVIPVVVGSSPILHPILIRDSVVVTQQTLTLLL